MTEKTEKIKNKRYFDLLGLCYLDAGAFSNLHAGTITGIVSALYREKRENEKPAPAHSDVILLFIIIQCKALNMNNNEGVINQIPFISSTQKIANEFNCFKKTVVYRALKYLIANEWITADTKKGKTEYKINVSKINKVTINRHAEVKASRSNKYHKRKEDKTQKTNE